MNEENFEPGFRSRMGSALDRAERVYLRVLRAAILVIATLMLGYAGWLALGSAYKLSRSPDSVVEAVATVNADDITDAAMPVEKVTPVEGAAAPAAAPEQRGFYDGFVRRYHALYSRQFEPFRQAEDKNLSRGEFDDNFVGSQARLEAIGNGELGFEADKADLESLLAVMTEAAAKPKTQARLKKYQSAKKVRVAKKVQKTKTEYRQGWDSYSTACSGWYYSPVGCPVQRAVQVPYTDTVYAMEFPEGTQSHTQIFRAFQDRYFELLEERRMKNARKAERERSRILAGYVEGGVSLVTALQIAAGFLVLMFFFLLIAIERHQRRISDKLGM